MGDFLFFAICITMDTEQNGNAESKIQSAQAERREGFCGRLEKNKEGIQRFVRRKACGQADRSHFRSGGRCGRANGQAIGRTAQGPARHQGILLGDRASQSKIP